MTTIRVVMTTADDTRVLVFRRKSGSGKVGVLPADG